MTIAKVIVDLSLDKGFDYLVPETLQARIRVGTRVRVPFGRTEKSGFVIEIHDHSDSKYALKEISALDRNGIELSDSLLKLANWIADYYCCTKEQAVRTLLPGAVRHGKVQHKTQKLYSIADLAAVEKFIAENSSKKSAQKRIAILKTLRMEHALPEDTLLARSECAATSAVLKTLLKDQLICLEKETVYRDIFAHSSVVADQPKSPTAEQKAALEVITSMLEDSQRVTHTALLFGITGSGKTEIYLQAIAHAIALGKSAIVLVPEISLTPQTVRRFRARFGDNLSVLHSRLSDGERFDQYAKIKNQQVRIVVGARSALFAPLENLGLIVVDEEHESSYKQSETPRYSARDVAVMRGKLENAVVLLGSATPSLESYYNALHGKYRLLKLTERAAHQSLPSVRVVDLRLGKGVDKDSPQKNPLFTPVLIQAVNERLRNGEQTILFLNRRGFSRELSCPNPECSYVATCPDCSVSYIYHRAHQTLSCYLCGNVAPVPHKCPMCGSEEIRYKGVGTEKIEDITRKLFPFARVSRMDSDTMRGADAHEIELDKFRRGEIDILIGTQMIAKGLDFPNVTLVGIINADQGLNIPDVRASERTFQLLTQVAGRAGRGNTAGEVIVQTFSPFNDVIRYAVEQDFPAFYEYDIAVREALHYPPFGHLIAVYFRGEDEETVAAQAAAFALKMQPFLTGKQITATPPEPAPIARIKGLYRYYLTFRGEQLAPLRHAIRFESIHNRNKNVEISVDVDASMIF